MADARAGGVLERRRCGTAKRSDDAREHHDQPVPAGVDHACLAQHRQEFRASLERLTTCLERTFNEFGDHRVLLEGRGVTGKPCLAHVGELGGHAGGHLAHDCEHRPLRRAPHRAIRLVGRPGHGRADEHGVDKLPWAARELLRRSSHELRDDHTRASARPEQRSPCNRRDDVLAVDLVGLAAPWSTREPIQLLNHGAQCEHHVVARVGIGDGEDVERVHLLTTGLQRRQSRLDHRAEANDARVGHLKRRL
jgi:hypothetical protein